MTRPDDWNWTDHTTTVHLTKSANFLPRNEREACCLIEGHIRVGGV